MPIVDGSRVVGIVTRRDLVRVLAREDQAIATDIRHRLANYSGLNRWTVDVHDGVVNIGGEYHDPTDRHVAVVLAEAVPGVTAVHTTLAEQQDEE
jgi:osmotically-inducible protein OsmY